MRFWDASAIVPLLVHEPASARMDAILAVDRAIVAWCGTTVECASAIERLRRDAALDAAGARDAMARLRRLATSWIEVPASRQVREHALRLLRVHTLRAADALQLAAALVAANQQPDTLELVSLDARQAEAAAREGFPLVA